MKSKRAKNRILYIIIIGILFPLTMKKEPHLILVENLITNIKYIISGKYKEGKIDIELFKKSTQTDVISNEDYTSYFGSIYKSDGENRIELKKELSNDEYWISSYRYLTVGNDKMVGYRIGSAKTEEDGLFLIIFQLPGLIEINNLKNEKDKSLLIFTKFDYYKNIFGIPLLWGFAIFVLVTNFFLSKKIDETEEKKKPIIML